MCVPASGSQVCSGIRQERTEGKIGKHCNRNLCEDRQKIKPTGHPHIGNPGNVDGGRRMARFMHKGRRNGRFFPAARDCGTGASSPRAPGMTGMSSNVAMTLQTIVGAALWPILPQPDGSFALCRDPRESSGGTHRHASLSVAEAFTGRSSPNGGRHDRRGVPDGRTGEDNSCHPCIFTS